MNRTLRLILIFIVTFVTGGTSGLALGSPYTGCLGPGGTISKIAPGYEPLKPCSTIDQQITLGGSGADELPITDFYDVHSDYFWVTPGSSTVGSVVCDNGDYVTGGGVDTSNYQARIINSRPFYSGVPAVPGGWTVTVYNTGTSDITFEVWAMCADVTPE